MRFAIDIDGVVADFIDAFKREVNKVWPGKLEADYQPSDWDWSDKMTKAETSTIWAIIKKIPNFWLSLRPCFDNVHAIAVHRLRHPNDEIFYVTARVSTAGMSTMNQTQQWLNECGIGGLGTSVIVDNSGDKVPIFNALECDANVDDKLEATIEHSKRTRGAYLLSRPWNEADRPSGIRTVASLEEFFRITRRNVSAGV